MWREFWIVAALCGVFVGFLAWASASATFLFNHPRTTGLRVEIDRATGQPIVMQKLAEIKAAEAQARAPGAKPKVQADKLEYDFGVMDPLTMGRHAFVLKNVGTAPLKLDVGPTTCKCTVSGLDKRDVAPGGQAMVTLEWNTGNAPVYSHAATIYTSDPARKSLEVRVSGKVRMQLGADVSELVLADIPPTSSAVAECFVYSQMWDQFEVESVDSKLAGLKWELTSVPPDAAPQLYARAITRLRVTLPAENVSTRFSDTLRIVAKVVGQDEHVTLQLPIQGNVLGRYTVYGGDIVGDAVQLGSVPWGRGKRTKLLIKVRDHEPELGEVRVEAHPSLLQARLTPREEASPKGLYDLHLELPADTAPCQYLGTPQGEVVITTDHPRLGTLRFPVRFAVIQRQD
ncbi:MAG: DUF1573 domain-containing protein [Planctomycetaceae bacterium]|nr:DUF1573 domain-containing protein [Planctomycetaceae bacterium]